MIFFCPSDGKRLRGERDALDLIGESGRDTSLIVIPVERLDEDFFRLKTGVAGAMLQKFMTYGKRIAIVGDISRYKDESSSFRDFVIECDRGSFLRFFEDRHELESSMWAQPLSRERPIESASSDADNRYTDREPDGG